MNDKTAANIDEYVADFPDNVQVLLQQIRALIKEIVPDAQEAIKYGMPTFIYHGNLVHFAAYKRHIGFYPVPTKDESFKEELSRYKTGRGSVQFPLGQPLPFPLIKRLVQHQVKQNRNKAVKKKTLNILTSSKLPRASRD